jgi:hypothetical protein
MLASARFLISQTSRQLSARHSVNAKNKAALSAQSPLPMATVALRWRPVAKAAMPPPT